MESNTIEGVEEISPFGHVTPKRFGYHKVILGFVHTDVDADNTHYAKYYPVSTKRVRNTDDAYGTIGLWLENFGA